MLCCHFARLIRPLVNWFILFKIIRDWWRKMSLYQFMLQMETTQRAVIITAMRGYVLLPRTAKLSWAPGYVMYVRMRSQRKGRWVLWRAGFNRWCQPSESAMLTKHMSAGQVRILRACALGIISSGNARDTRTFSFYRYPFFWTHPSPSLFLFFFKSSPLSMLSGDVTRFHFILILFKVGCSSMIFLGLP